MRPGLSLPRRAARQRAARLPPAARRAQLLACAIRVFARRGLSGAHHAEIAREAGVSVSATFVYFPSRAALVSAVLDEVARFYLAQAEAVHRRRDLLVPDLILAHGTVFAESITAQPDHATVWLEWSTAFRSETWPGYVAFHDQVVALVKRTLRRGQREGSIHPRVVPLDAARLIVAAAHMVAHLIFAGAPRTSVLRFMRSLIRSLTTER